MKKSALIFLILFGGAIFPQSWKNLNTQNSNIPTDNVLSVYIQDASNIWLGTEDTGAVRLQGGTFTAFNASNSLINDNHINCVIRDETDFLWAASEYHGLFYLHNAKWYRVTPLDMGFNLGPYESLIIRSLAAQHGGPFNPDGRGALWVGTYRHGVLRFDGKKWTLFSGVNNKMIFGNVGSIAIEESKSDTSYVVWIGTSLGLYKYDGKNWENVPIENDSTKWINAITLENGGPTFSNGKIFVGTQGGKVCWNDGYGWSSMNFADYWNPNNAVNAIKIDKLGRWWIATSEEGLAMYDGKAVYLYYKENSNIPANDVLSLDLLEEKDSTEVWTTCYDWTDFKYTGLTIFKYSTVTSVKNNNPTTFGFELKQNYPNPFNPATKIEYSIPNVKTSNFTQTRVTLKIYDLLGREIQTLVNKFQKPGNYSVQFNAGNLPSGVYVYRLQAGDLVRSRKMILIK